MGDEDPDRNSFEEVARALAEEASRAVERLSEIDLEGIARTAGDEAERARRWVEGLARSLRQPGDAARDVRFEATRSRSPAPARRGSAARRRAAPARPPQRSP